MCDDGLLLIEECVRLQAANYRLLNTATSSMDKGFAALPTNRGAYHDPASVMPGAALMDLTTTSFNWTIQNNERYNIKNFKEVLTRYISF